MRNRDAEKNLAKWPVSLLGLATSGPRPPFRERRTVVGERSRHAWRGSGMPSIDSRGSRGFLVARLNRQCRARLEYARPTQRENRYVSA